MTVIFSIRCVVHSMGPSGTPKKGKAVTYTVLMLCSAMLLQIPVCLQVAWLCLH